MYKQNYQRADFVAFGL